MSKKSTINLIKKRKNLFYGLIFIAILFSLSYIVCGKLFKKNNVVVGAVNISPKIESKEEIRGKSKEVNKKANEESQDEAKTTAANLTKQNENKSDVRENAADSTQKNNVQAVFVNPYNKDGKKAAYLTFDDGPSTNTPHILDTLKKYNIKATFFIVGKMANENKEMLKREKAEGHTIGNHSYSHDYNYVYANSTNYLDDLQKNNEVLASILDGYTTKLIRFPGGSFGDKKAGSRQAVEKAGYHYVDWNALNGDAEASLVPADKLVMRLKTTVGNQEHVVILMHDAPGKTTTVQALPQIIEYLKSQGYEFRAL
jgi:peptidoglycan/xylan/chitin deacetylase (PgdA/CDA1 family)